MSHPADMLAPGPRRSGRGISNYMPSLIAWLDASTEDQRRMREIVKLFSDTESRDELGIGQIRDALSDILFPGTSTLFTRARYMLFVPWIFTHTARRGHDGDKLLKRVDSAERKLIEALRRDGATAGLIGVSAGAAVRTLPSALYLVALRKYEILAPGVYSLSDAAEAHAAARDNDDSLGPWSPTLPPPPEGFPETTGTGFDLTFSEASWLRDRILSGAPGSAMSHFAEHRPDSESAAPWEDPTIATAPPHLAAELDHARLFSDTMHGAALLYNLLLAEAHAEAGYESSFDRVADYRRRLDAWDIRRDQLRSDIAHWGRDDFWALIHSKNPRIRAGRTFVETWVEALATSAHATAEDPALRSIIRRREHAHKGAQSRLRNSRLLESWKGAAGAGQLVFRWPQVRAILLDIHDGLERPDA